MCRLVFISYADQFARTIALTVTMQTNLTRTYGGNGKLDGTRSLSAISASVFRMNESASPRAPIANSNSNHAPRSVRLRAEIKLCTGILYIGVARVKTHSQVANVPRNFTFHRARNWFRLPNFAFSFPRCNSFTFWLAVDLSSPSQFRLFVKFKFCQIRL